MKATTLLLLSHQFVQHQDAKNTSRVCCPIICRNQLIQHQVRRLRRQAQRQAGTTGESVSSSLLLMNIQPSQVKLIKEDKRRKHMDVNNNCAARKVGMPDISIATPSLPSSKEVLEEESSQQLRECLIRARFCIHTSRALLASHSIVYLSMFLQVAINQIIYQRHQHHHQKVLCCEERMTISTSLLNIVIGNLRWLIPNYLQLVLGLLGCQITTT